MSETIDNVSNISYPSTDPAGSRSDASVGEDKVVERTFKQHPLTVSVLAGGAAITGPCPAVGNELSSDSNTVSSPSSSGHRPSRAARTRASTSRRRACRTSSSRNRSRGRASSSSCSRRRTRSPPRATSSRRNREAWRRNRRRWSSRRRQTRRSKRRFRPPQTSSMPSR